MNVKDNVLIWLLLINNLVYLQLYNLIKTIYLLEQVMDKYYSLIKLYKYKKYWIKKESL